MRKILAAILGLGCVSCSAPDTLTLPPLPHAPNNWYEFRASTIPGSECPQLDGVYLEPPIVHRQGANNEYLPKDRSWLYSAYIPLHRADRSAHSPDALEVPRNGFVIRQSDPSAFHFLFWNHQATEIAQYHFRSEEGDFECHSGYIEFPTLSSYGMIEGRSVNFQIRNVLLTDETGALVIQSTRGLFRGNPPEMQNSLMYEFFRYPRME